MKRNISIVTYHDIQVERNPFTAHLFLSTRPELFREHIAYFVKNFDLMSANELLSGKLPRRPLLLTFDDAYRSVLSIAGPLLKDVKAPSIFFVIPSAVQGDSLPIDNVLSFAVEMMGFPRVLALIGRSRANVSSVSDVISRFIATMCRNEIAELKARIFADLGITEAAARQMSKIFLDVTDMRNLEGYGIEVGNHSLTHSHFRMLSGNELDIEIGQSRRELQRLSGQRVRCLSIPYGDERDATDSAMAATQASGHDAIFLVHARSNRFRRREDIYYRVSLRDEGTEKMWLLLGVYPILRSLLHGLTS